MSILTKEQLDDRKSEARKREIRQNVKSHCTKIRDGILKNGSTSGNRAIWELFQNAGDLAKDGCAKIRITLNEGHFIFAHKGEPFTDDSLCSLIKQVSAEEKEGDDTVGQYGTGFLTTHKFSRKITVNGSMQISDNPLVFVDVDDFVINRENFDDIPKFIDDMTEQIAYVEGLMDAEQKPSAKDWTTLDYELNKERTAVAQTAIDEAIKLMPYVLTFNDKIGSCAIIDNTRGFKKTYNKCDKETGLKGLLCKSILISDNDGDPIPFDCYYLELHEGESRIILPLETETQVRSLGDTPRLFVHFPLIGPNYFGVNFLFHSHRFTPEEPRDNIIVPRDNDATQAAADRNATVLDEMTAYLWRYLENNVETWTDTIKMASLKIRDNGHSESKTEEYYKDLKAKWNEEYSKLKLIDVDGVRYSMNEGNHPLVLEPTLEAFLSSDLDSEESEDFLSIIYPYAKGAGMIPCKKDLLRWSQIIAEWNPVQTSNFLTLEDIVKYVSTNQGSQLYSMLKIIVNAKHTEFFDSYALIPNREGVLKVRESLRDAKYINADLYKLVFAIDSKICDKMVDVDFANIIKLTPYNRQHLREELNALVKKVEDETWKDTTNPHAYTGEFEKHLINLCSAFTTQNGDSKRNKLMPVICRFEGLTYTEKYIPAAEDDDKGFDLYRQLFISLVENQMMKIDQRDAIWVKANYDNLMTFVNEARGDDYKSFCTRYAIYPDMNGELHSPDELKKNVNVSTELFELYHSVLGEDLKAKCVDANFEMFYAKYAEAEHQYTPQNVAKSIQNKLSEGGYQDRVLLDIIDNTELPGAAGLQWQMLFKDIFDQRESIRYKLGTSDERKAINRMMKRKDPELLTLMADVAERNDAHDVIGNVRQVINDMEHDAHIKMLGAYVERHVQQYLSEALTCIGVTVENQQCGQDFILSKPGYDDYHVEVKSRWESDQSVEMSATQFRCAVDAADRYALVRVNMYHYDHSRAEQNDPMQLTEIYNDIACLDNIGTLEADLRERADEAFKGEEADIRLDGSYKVRVPQNVFKEYPLDFNGLVDRIKKYFSK